MIKDNWYNETLYETWGQRHRIEKILFEAKTEHQHLVIFESIQMGRVMALDGVIQTTEADEFVYHEMLTHVPIISHGNAKRVLIVGGGDGGILREVARHKSVESITMVEIDGSVVEMSKQHLPKHSAGAFDDKRLKLVIDDAANFVKHCNDKFDVIISDSTDPMGPGEVLFTDDFYANCKKCLTEGGVLVTQNGVCFMQQDEVANTYARQSKLFKDAGFYVAAVPTYVGGFMTLAWATDNTALRNIPLETVQERFNKAGFQTRYYTPEIHKACFALPAFVQGLMKDKVAKAA